MKKHRSGLWAMALRNIARRPRRSILSAVAIGTAALTMVLLMALVAGMKYDMADTIKRFSTGDILIQSRDFQRAGARKSDQFVAGAAELAARLASGDAKIPGVASVSGRIAGSASVFVDGEAVIFPFYGLEAGSDPVRLAEFVEAGGRLPASGSREAIISRALADRLKLKIGDSLTPITQTRRGSSNGISFTVVGLLSATASQFNGPWLFMDWATAQRFVHLDDGATSLLVKLAPGADPDATLAAIRQALPADGSVKAAAWNQSSQTYNLMVMGEFMYNFIGIFFFALASTVMINTMLMIVLERSREIGTLAALGMERRAIRRLFLAESAILSTIGAVAGCLLGGLISLLLGNIGLDFSQTLQGMNLELSPILRPRLEWFTPVIVLVTAVAVSTAFTLIPVRRIGRMEIVAALRGI